MKLMEEALELLIDDCEMVPGSEYQLDNGDRYQLVEIINKLDAAEKVALLRKTPSGESLICPISWFSTSRFKRIYNLDSDLKTLSLMVTIFKNGLQHQSESSTVPDFVSDSIQSIPQICQRMKMMLWKVRRDRE